jgi:hypothetical protein
VDCSSCWSHGLDTQQQRDFCLPSVLIPIPIPLSPLNYSFDGTTAAALN